MKKIKLIILVSIIYFFYSEANAQQPCTNENLHSISGTWKNTGFVTIDHAAADVVKERPVLQVIFSSIRNNFKWELKGGQINYNDHSMMNANCNLPLYISKKINAFGVYLTFHDFLCLHGRIDVSESSMGIAVLCNQYPFKFDKSFFTKTIVDPTTAEQNSEDNETNVYFISNILPDFKNGIWDFFSGEKNGAEILTMDSAELNSLQHVYRIVAKPGIEPVIAMSKKEYYDGWIKKFQFEVNENNKQIKKINSSKDSYLDADTKKKMSEMYEGLRKVASDNINAIEEVRKNLTPEQLSKPAVFHEEEGKYIETPDSSKNELYILKPNPDYFNTKLPKSTPQFFSIDVNVVGKNFGLSEDNPRKSVYQKFVDEIFRMNAIELVTEKIKPLIQK